MDPLVFSIEAQLECMKEYEDFRISREDAEVILKRLKEVVRCKDCKHLRMVDGRDFDLGIYGDCELNQCDDGIVDNYKTFFCAFGERKEEQ